MAVAHGRIGHQDQLTVVGHLEELRARLIVSLAALAVAFGLCLWQNHTLLNILNKPLAQQTVGQAKAGRGALGATYAVQQGARTVAAQLGLLVSDLERPRSGLSSATRESLKSVLPALERAVARLSKSPQGEKPVTLGIGEPFTTTVGVAFLFAFILALPVILYELYSFVLPAFAPGRRRAASSLMLAIPMLFIVGVTFGYLLVLPAAVRFFQNFNSDQFNVLVQASQYYHFAAVTLLAMGLLFQVPVGILAATQSGVVGVRQLRRNRRYAIIACAAVAAFLPGDAITLVLETLPLYVLFEASLLLASMLERHKKAQP